MKKITAFAIGLLGFFLAATAVGSPTEGKRIIISGDANFPPYEFIEETNGQKIYRGFNVDILQAIALQTGMEIEFRPLPWAEAVRALDNGEVDAIQGMKYGKERAQKYDFSEEYITTSLGIFVLKDTYIADIHDLSGHKVAVQYGDIAYQQLKENDGIILYPTENQEEAIRLLLAGTVNAVVGNRLTGQYILQKNKQLGKVKIVGPPIDPQRYGIVVRKGNDELLAMFNKGLREIKKNGTYDKIYIKWFGEPLDYPARYYKQKLFLSFCVFISVLAVFGLAVAIFYRLNLLLKSEVRKRTKELEAVNEELVRKNEYIRNENAYKEKLLNSGYSGIITLDGRGCIQFANDYAKRYLSNGEDILGKHFRETLIGDFFPPEGVEETLKKQDPVTHGELLIDGINIEYTYFIPEVHNREAGLILHFRDVTEQRQLREQIIRRDKMESLGNLVAGIAHEIRTPLTSIKTFVELLPVKFDNPVFREKISQYVPQEIERMNAIINDLLEYARPRKPLREMVEVKPLVTGILVLFSNQFEKNNIKVNVAIDDQIKIFADKQQVKQVLINIILNAIQSMDGVADPCLCISGHAEECQVVIAVEDNGCGIAETNVKKIFDPFFTTKPSGTGLGLSISYQFVKENNGDIDVESRENTGTRMSIRFPAAMGKVV